MHVVLQGISFSLSLYSLPLTGLDLVFGVQWLEQLGTLVCNWKKTTMEFTWENQVRRLHGMDTNAIQSASLKSVGKEFKQGSPMFAIYLHSLEEVPQHANHPDMQ